MRNLITSFAFFLARLAAVVIQLKFVERYFGPQYGGLNALLAQVTFYVLLVEMGLSVTAVSLLYEPIKNSHHRRTAELLTALRRDAYRLTAAAAPIVFALLYVYSGLIQSTLPRRVIFLTLVLTGISGLVTLLSIHFQAFLNAAERIYDVHTVLSIGFILKTAVGLPIAIASHNYLFLPATIAIISIGEVLAMRRQFRRAFPAWRHVHAPEARREIRSRAKYVLMHKIGGIIYYQSDFIILSVAASLTVVKDYAQFQYVLAGIVGLSNAVFNSLTTSIARCQLDVNPEERWRQYRFVSLATFFAGLSLACAFYFTAKDLVQILFGSVGIVSSRTLLLFGVVLFLNVIKSVDDAFITAVGAFHVWYWLPILEAGSYLILGTILALRVGFEGILVAAIITNIVFVVISKAVVMARGVLHGSIARLTLLKARSFIMAFVSAIPVIALLFATAHWEPGVGTRFVLLNIAVTLYMVPIVYYFAIYGYRTAPANRNVSETGVRLQVVPEGEP